ncbi:MAG: 3-oxoacyl-acyl-carrier protein reductase [Spirochaetes bacterium]|nr:MAG: 3-oxoacyl-acyl-carrier protein reductase [Spirochaetota bacterium]
MKLEHKIAVITGAARGIGFEIAQCFAKEGAHVVIVDTKGAMEAATNLQKAGFAAEARALDISDYKQVADSIDAIVSELGSLDILVNNAGIIARGTILDLDKEQWLKIMDVNVNGNFYLCKAAIPHMIRQKGGSIVNITSIAGKMGDITAAPVYGASKGAINTLTKSLARQLAEFGIRVNAVAPHAIDTDMSAEWSPEKRKAVIESIPLKRMGQPKDVAQAALFLVSDNASFITGETINVNGGYLMD